MLQARNSEVRAKHVGVPVILELESLRQDDLKFKVYQN